MEFQVYASEAKDSSEEIRTKGREEEWEEVPQVSPSAAGGRLAPSP
jgi:hypothetical protein